MLRNKIINLIEKEFFEDKEKIKNCMLPTIGFKIVSGSTDARFSKIGGYPPIFENYWPLLNDHPLTFLGQIAMSQVNEMNNVLPKEGVLCFFIYTKDIGYRFPDCKGEFKVMYVKDHGDELSRVKICNEKEIINEYMISFFEYFTFPSYQESVIEKMHISEEELDVIDEIDSEILLLINENCETEHQLLGYPRALQGTVNFWWSVKYLGFQGKETFSNHELELIRKEEENFILLLQVNFNDSKIEIDLFGDSVAYFGIHKNDLQACNFDNVILVMQNT